LIPFPVSETPPPFSLFDKKLLTFELTTLPPVSFLYSDLRTSSPLTGGVSYNLFPFPTCYTNADFFLLVAPYPRARMNTRSRTSPAAMRLVRASASAFFHAAANPALMPRSPSLALSRAKARLLQNGFERRTRSRSHLFISLTATTRLTF